MLHVVLSEHRESLLKTWVALAVGHCPHHEHPNTVAHEATHVVGAVLGHTTRAQSIVGACRKVGESVEQRAVEVENKSLFHDIICLAFISRYLFMMLTDSLSGVVKRL